MKYTVLSAIAVTLTTSDNHFITKRYEHFGAHFFVLNTFNYRRLNDEDFSRLFRS